MELRHRVGTLARKGVQMKIPSFTSCQVMELRNCVTGRPQTRCRGMVPPEARRGCVSVEGKASRSASGCQETLMKGAVRERGAGPQVAQVSHDIICPFWGQEGSGASPETPVMEVMAAL